MNGLARAFDEFINRLGSVRSLTIAALKRWDREAHLPNLMLAALPFAAGPLLLCGPAFADELPSSEGASMTELAHRYQNGIGCPRDIGRALLYYKRAAQLKNPAAMIALGDLYDAGVCVPGDFREAVSWYRQAADLRFAPAMMRLGAMTERGRGLRFVLADAIGWYRKAADLGYGPAMTRLADLDSGQAADWLEKAVQAKDPPAFAKLAARVEDSDRRTQLYERGAALEDPAAMTAVGLKSPPEQAAVWFRKAAEGGDAQGMVRFAELCERGVAGVPQSTGQAVVWYEKAARAGEPAALTRIGELHEQGVLLKRDLPQARLLYKRAADAGYAPAVTRLAKLIEPEEPARAQTLYRTAAEHGDPAGMFRYAMTLPRGEAGHWIQRAADGGDPDALARLGLTKRAAEAGHIASMIKLGWFERAALAGSSEAMRRFAGTRTEASEAARWMAKAAEAGDALAMTSFGNALLSGRGVSPDQAAAKAWFEKATGRGDAEAMFRLGKLRNDAALVRKSAEGGFPLAMIATGELTGDRSWYERAAQAGLANGWTKLGKLEWGAQAGDPEAKMLLGDRERNAREAYRLYSEAAAAGYAPAMAKVAECHLDGRGTYRSDVDALKWFRAAAEAGYGDVAARVRELEARVH